MAIEQAPSFENDIISPALEMGAFEALWAEDVSSFKQLREKVVLSKSGLLSGLVEHSTANQFYEKTLKLLHTAKIENFGLRIEGTIDYPETLHDADYPVILLYYRGIWDLVFTPGISIVGTRNPSPDGVQRTKRLTKELVNAGYTIYSGLAKGIDTIAHSTAIEFGGQTVAVIGTPLSMCYPPENKALQEEIAKNHLLISQVPIFSYSKKNINFNRHFFPERNKTMSALSKATVIVEAGETSGTLIQAKAALKQGRKVFILNNNFENPHLTWPNKFLQIGAIRVNDVTGILQGL